MITSLILGIGFYKFYCNAMQADLMDNNRKYTDINAINVSFFGVVSYHSSPVMQPDRKERN